MSWNLFDKLSYFKIYFWGESLGRCSVSRVTYLFGLWSNIKLALFGSDAKTIFDFNTACFLFVIKKITLIALKNPGMFEHPLSFLTMGFVIAIKWLIYQPSCIVVW